MSIPVVMLATPDNGYFGGTVKIDGPVINPSPTWLNVYRCINTPGLGSGKLNKGVLTTESGDCANSTDANGNTISGAKDTGLRIVQ